ncbi:MAG: response regulator transcription factor [Ignavibacteriaceae bacterium]
MIKILLADDHAVLREGLKVAIEMEPELEVIGEAENGLEALEMCCAASIDLVIMDIKMPVMDGIQASKKIKEKMPGIKILLLTMYDNKEFIIDALSAGIDGYILKMSDMQKVYKAIYSIISGDHYFDVEVSKLISEDFLKKSSAQNFRGIGTVYNLTERELEVLKLLGRGYTSSEIAKELQISYYTVRNHRSNLLTKLNMKNSAELIMFALREGIIN